MLDQEPYRLRLRRTKIVATIGIASESEEILEAMIRAGVNVARLNFSHGTHESHGKVIHLIRKISARIKMPVAILGDLCGPKIRVGKFQNGSIQLREGSEVTIVADAQLLGTDGIIPSQYEELIGDIRKGQSILFDDGLLEVEVTEIESKDRARVRIIRGGVLKNHKGMNIPGAALSTPALTAKDRDDLSFAVRNRLDYVALSFVRTVEEVVDAKKRIFDLLEGEDPKFANRSRKDIGVTRVIAKIEKPQALEQIEGIIDAADGVMVARGDLGVELPPEKVPIIQGKLIALASERNKPVIVATQMLESMIDHARPTRAEVSDVATAVLSMTDAVMLSGETAAGKYPVDAVRYMDRIIREIESHQWSQEAFGRLQSNISLFPVPKALARACTLLSQDMPVRAINVLTRSGQAARIMSSSRPSCPVLSYSNDPMVLHQAQLYWGVYPIHSEEEYTLETFAEIAGEKVKEMNIAEPGHYILLVSSPLKSPHVRSLNSIIITEVT